MAPASNSPLSLTSLNKAITALDKVKAKLASVERLRLEPIAIIGMACRFPGGANTPEAFFQLLQDGTDAVTEVPTDRWQLEAAEDSASDPERRAIRWGGFLREAVDRFDAGFFGISRREAEYLDPQQRLLLEVGWEALERAGQDPARLVGSQTGVFVGMTTTDYADLCKAAGESGENAYALTGNGHCFAPGRLSYTFGFQGPCIAIDTACSSSLVSVHLACQSLRTGEATMALAGGVNLMLSADTTRLIATSQGLSPDGRCKAFDAAASGFVRSEGCGMVVLKLLSEAQRDGDTILGLIRGSAMNQDGRSTGLTAPNVLSQQAMLKQALVSARVAAGEIGYVETHGTGTSLGDPIELEALKAVLGRPRADETTCVLGAVKTNIGHTEAAAGIAGLIKAVMVLQREVIPKNLHFRALNPRISVDGTPFVIPTDNVPWPRGGKIRFAGVSSFGMSGTNAHVILEEAPLLESSATSAQASTYLVPVSAKSPAALHELAASYAKMLAAADGPQLADVAYTASVRRTHYEHRLTAVGQTRGQVAESLAALAAAPVKNASDRKRTSASARPKVVFVFPGQGSQWLGMGRQLLAEEPVFHEAMTAIDEVIRRQGGFSALAELMAPEGLSRLAEIDVVQPLLFAIEVALSALWQSWGVEPDCVVGHSMGEVAAAHVAGILSLEDAAKVICRRSRLLRRVSGKGAMALVDLDLASAEEALSTHEDQLSIAVSNGPRSTVISGDPAALEELLETLEKAGVFFRRVKVDVASHSPQMDPLRQDLLTALRNVHPRPGRIAMRSTVTGEIVKSSGLDAYYWAKNLRDPVLFSSVTRRLIDDGYSLFVEMSPHPILLPSIEENLQEKGQEGVAIGSLRRNVDEQNSMLESLGALYTRGYPVDWKTLQRSIGRSVALPTYPWQRERFWLEASAPARKIETHRARASVESADDLFGETARSERRITASHRTLDLLRSASPTERQDRLEALILQELARVMRVEPTRVDRGESFYNYGFDSLMGLELRNRLQTALGLKLSIADIVVDPRIDALAQLLAPRLGLMLDGNEPDTLVFHSVAPRPASPVKETPPGSWVVTPQPAPEARLRLFCFPYSGGSASMFGAWPDHLPPEIELCAIQLPGRQERLHEPLLRSVEEMVAALVPALLPYLDRPFATFGHSLGAIVMFETLRRIAAAHSLKPIHVFVSGAPSPRRFLMPNLTSRSPAELDDLVRFIGFGRADVTEDEDAARHLLPALMADLEACALYAYVPSAPFDAPITAFAGREDLLAPPDSMDDWRAHTSMWFSKNVFPGEHDFIATDRDALLRIVGEELVLRLATIEQRQRSRSASVAPTSNDPRWLRSPEPRSTPRIRLICFPGLGQTSSMYRRWPAYLGDDVEVCMVDLPGRGPRTREGALGRVDEIVELLLPALVPFLDRPFAFFGFDIGAIVMFEVARQLRREKRTLPSHLFVGAATAPHVHHFPPMHHLTHSRLLAGLRFLGILVNESEPSARALRADCAAMSSYLFTEEAPFGMPITTFLGERDSFASAGGVRAWREQTTASFELHMSDGAHDLISHDASALLSVVREALNKLPPPH